MRKLLLLLLAIGAIVQTTKAQFSRQTINGIEYTISTSGKASVNKCIDKSLSNVDIPNQIYGYAEDEWGDVVFSGYASAFPNNEIHYTTSNGYAYDPTKKDVFGANIISNTYSDGEGIIKFDGDVTTIGNDAFYNMSSYTSISLPSSVTTIGERAFYGCSGLVSIDIPEGVTSIGSRTFYGCTELTSFNIPEGITKISDYMFYNCSKITSYDIPNHITSIGNYAFYGTKLSSITIPGNVKSVGNYAFYQITSSTSLAIEGGVESIGEYAFFGCSGITTIHIPTSVISIGKLAFNQTGWYNNQQSDKLLYIDDCLVGKKGVNIYDPQIKSGTRIIADQALYSTSFKSPVSIPGSVTHIGNQAFGYCENMPSIIIPEGVVSIGDYAFTRCKALTSFIIPEGVEGIANGTFNGCISLEDVTIPSSVASIGNEAFSGCVGLNTITCNATTPPSCGTDVFYDVNKSGVVLIVPEGSETLYANDANWNEFRNPDKTITLGASDYSTYCTNVNLDFSEVEGLKAYIASSFNPSTGSLTITRVTNVPAGEGILLKGTAGESYDVPVTSDASVVANLMKGNTTSITLDPTTGEYTNFVLSQNSEGVMGFYRFNNSITMPAHKAWLQIPTSAIGSGSPAHARGFRFVEEGDEMTGIADIEENSANSDFIYDLQGRRLNSQPAHGLYIQNGKKIIK